MADTLILRDERFLAHDNGPGHPERSERLVAVHRDLDAHPIAGTVTEAPRAVERPALERVHGRAHVERMAGTEGRSVRLDPDTTAGPRSYEAALLAAGAAVDATRAVVGGRAEGAFALVRPPGHHAEALQAMGFCLFNNVAVAAADAIAEGGLSRVLVADPDVHHGNGTQHAFWRRRDVLYLSSHRVPFYPGTGAPEEVGEGEGAGYSVNLPVGAGATDDDFLHLYARVAAPIVAQYEPELILVSAGFDTWHRDPLGGTRMTESGFERLFGLFRSWADAHCPGRLVLALEGGYDLDGVVTGVRTALEVVAGAREAEPIGEIAPSERARAAEARVRRALEPRWRLA